MPYKCRNCGSYDLRVSKLRFSDAFFLLGLRYPVRCRYCHERLSLFIPLVVKIREAEKARMIEARKIRKAQAVKNDVKG